MTPASSFMSDRPYEVSHRTKGSHWCGHRECWAWVVDCVHCANPHRLTPKDHSVHSIGYDATKRHGWKSSTNGKPARSTIDLAGNVSPDRTRDNVHNLLAEWIKQHRIKWDEVRTERKLVASMLCGVRLIVERTILPPSPTI